MQDLTGMEDFAGVDSRVFEELLEVAGKDRLVTDPEILASYLVDWTRRWKGFSSLMLRPQSTLEVSEYLKVLSHYQLPVQIQGGNTGMSGGSVPMGGEVLLSLENLSGIEELDQKEGRILVNSGTTLSEVQRAAEKSGWRYPVDFGSRDSATIGGTVATNAGGVHVMRSGMTRSQVLGVESVLADGQIVSSLKGLIKDNTGYDLPALFSGSEGTLGVITRVLLRLSPQHEEEVVALVGFEKLSYAMEVSRILKSNSEVQAIELMFKNCLDVVVEYLGNTMPIVENWPVVLLIEAAGREGVVHRFGKIFDELKNIGDVAVAVDESGKKSFWRYRDAHSEAIGRRGIPQKLDVSLPLNKVVLFIEEVQFLLGDFEDCEGWIFGHAGDGNLHVNLTGIDPEDTHFTNRILNLVVDLGGSISAEHGVGRSKGDWLELCRGVGEVDVFRSLKNALDPKNILNPGVLFPKLD